MMQPMTQLSMTVHVRAVLDIFLDNKDNELFGNEICDLTGISPGTIYPMLKRMEKAGWLISHWEDTTPEQRSSRPPRHYYRLAPDYQPDTHQTVRRNAHESTA